MNRCCMGGGGGRVCLLLRRRGRVVSLLNGWMLGRSFGNVGTGTVGLEIVCIDITTSN